MCVIVVVYIVRRTGKLVFKPSWTILPFYTKYGKIEP